MKQSVNKKLIARPKVFVEAVGNDLEVLLGKPLELRCHASGTPTPSLMWKMIPSSYSLNGQSLNGYCYASPICWLKQTFI